VQHKPARRTGKLACRSGSVLSEGLGLHAGRSAPGAQAVPERAVQVRPPGARVQKRRCPVALKPCVVPAARCKNDVAEDRRGTVTEKGALRTKGQVAAASPPGASRAD
jgi:hypothetical protein